MRARAIRVALVTSLLFVASAPAVAGGFGVQSGVAQTQQVEPDAVVMHVALRPDGDARWEVAYRIRLDDDNATQAFKSLRDDVRANRTTFTERFATGMRRTARSAENATGREMAVRNVTVETERQFLPQEYGVVTYRFAWTNFAAVDGETVRAGDAISGLYIDSGTSLRVSWPERYGLAATPDPEPAETKTDEVLWVGPLSFDDGEPAVVVEPTPAAASTTSTTSTPGPTTTTPGGSGGGGPSPALLAAAAVVLAVLVGGGYWLTTRGGDGDGDAEAESVDSAGSDGGDGDANAGADGDEGPPAELLSNEERVLKLLEDNGGRMKQQEIASELDWTDAKTSQVVGTLRDDDEIETFRLGRENVVTLPEESLK
ncbi:MAG: helix-turn-helix transcriptional regulator [Haloarculaceae archaeon]